MTELQDIWTKQSIYDLYQQYSAAAGLEYPAGTHASEIENGKLGFTPVQPDNDMVPVAQAKQCLAFILETNLDIWDRPS